MRKIMVVICAVILAETCWMGAVNAAIVPNVRQHSKLYIKTGQLWESTELKGVRKQSPQWYWGGGWRVRLTADDRYNAALELKKGLLKDFTKVEWFLSYSF